jgi:hypothetical protein
MSWFSSLFKLAGKAAGGVARGALGNVLGGGVDALINKIASLGHHRKRNDDDFDIGHFDHTQDNSVQAMDKHIQKQIGGIPPLDEDSYTGWETRLPIRTIAAHPELIRLIYQRPNFIKHRNFEANGIKDPSKKFLKKAVKSNLKQAIERQGLEYAKKIKKMDKIMSNKYKERDN